MTFHIPFRHPALDVLAAFTAGELSPSERNRIAGHLRDCPACQESLRFTHQLEATSAQLPIVDVPDGLRARILSSRAAGTRTILPARPTELAPRSWRRVGTAIAAAAALVTALVLVMQPGELAAVAVDSELQLLPPRPQLGDQLTIMYKPAPGLFPQADSLILRARLRTPRDEMYRAHQTRAVAVLRSTGDGAYRTTVTLPDSIVFASFAVEDAAAERIDDHSGRLWEFTAHEQNGIPLYDAIEQRVNDMMGRSWEEAYASAKRLAELYPDRIGAWTLREFFERALYGDAADSVSASYRPRLERLIAEAKSLPSISEADMGVIFFRQRPPREKATAADSAEFKYWWTRMNREYPRHPQVAQHLAFYAYSGAPGVILDSLEAAYPRLVPLHGAGRNVYNAAFYAADQANDHRAYRRWLERSLAHVPDSARRMAVALATRPPFRPEGIEALRALLRRPAAELGVPRQLTQNRVDYARTLDDARRRLLAALGTALVADGQIKAGIDTLTLASRGAWDVEVFRTVAAAYLTAGDTASAMSARARIAADPRTTSGTVDSLGATGRKYFGSARWDSAVAVARSEMHQRLLERSEARSLRGKARVTAADGRVVDLSALTLNKPAVVIFWSRHCGAAIDALPAIARAANRLHENGTPVLLVVDDAVKSDVGAYLVSKNWKLPVYHDTEGNVANAFANFGTPLYYVLDGAGRIRFDSVEHPLQLVAQVEALQPQERAGATTRPGAH
jgi:hypothetical protein